MREKGEITLTSLQAAQDAASSIHNSIRFMQLAYSLLDAGSEAERLASVAIQTLEDAYKIANSVERCVLNEKKKR